MEGVIETIKNIINFIKCLLTEKDTHNFRVVLINIIVIYIFLIPNDEKTDMVKNILAFISICILYSMYFLAIEIFADLFVKEENEQ